MRHDSRPVPGTGARIVLVALSLVLLSGCGDGAPAERHVTHPIRDSLSVDPDDAVRIGRDESAPRSPALRELSSRLDHRSVAARIGALDGDPAYVFGEVTDALFLPDGSLAVLDVQADSVRVFDGRGRHRYSIGGSGEGPGELDFPVALLSPVEGELWVVDGARLIHRFGERDGELFFEDRVRIPGFARDACAGRGWAVLNVLDVPATAAGEHQAEILQRFDESGTPRGSFAAPYRYAHRIVFDRMTRGSVACGGDRVFLGFESLNRLDAYGVGDGRLLWHASFDGIRIPDVQERLRADGRRAVRGDLPEEGPFHFLLDVSGGDRLPLVVQYGRRMAEEIREGVDRYSVESFAVDPRTGEGTYLGDDLLQVLAVTGDRLALLDPDPYPRIEIVRLGPS